MYFHLSEIAIYLWLGSVEDTKEFQFAFHSRITQNYIFQVTNCRQIIFIYLCSRMAVSIVSFAAVIWSHYTMRSPSQSFCNE